ncbi:MAG: M48 family metalloprotease, partial [Candidatus Omnitrophica bacterium]|nr:M48 family metalloprotease [Candidatus Omnitrophota bacterium]
ILTALGGIAASMAMQNQETAQNVVALAAQALPATFSREDEKEADVLAAVFAHEAGYDASKAEYFFKMLAEKERAYNMEVSSKLLPALNAATSNYNAALSHYNAWANQYNLTPNQNNYNGLLNAKNQLDYYSYQLENAKAAYLNFALSNIGWFRTHPDSMSRADMYVKMSDYMHGEKSIEDLGRYDSSVVNILKALYQVQDLSRQGLLDKSGLRAMELFKKAQALYNNRNFLAAKNTLKEVLRLKPGYQDALSLEEDLDSYIEYFIENLQGKREREVVAVLGNPIESRKVDSEYIRKRYDFDGRVVLVYFQGDTVSRWTEETSR